MSYKLLNWIKYDKLNFNGLSLNTNAINLLTSNQDKINWFEISKNLSFLLI